MRNKAYWKRRASQRTTAINQLVDNYEKHLVSAFYQSVQNINDEIAKLYAKYAKDNSITYQEALLYLTDNERAEFQQDLQAYIKKASDPEYASQHKKELDSLSVRARVKRLEQMAANIMMEAEKLHNKLESGAGELFHKVYEESYYQTAFDTFKGRGIGVSFDKPSPYVIDSLLEYPWAGKSFSANVWDNERKFESKLNSVLTTGLIQGRSVQQMAKDLADAGLGARRDKGKYGGSLYDATRLVRTEANFVANQATAKMYDQLGVDEYEYLATLSDRTCERCGELDGKHWPAKDQVVGVNYPPIHANCRCTTIPYFDDLDGTRTAQSADGSWYSVPGDMTYNEWVNGLSEDEKGRMVLNQKMAKNRTADKVQYEKYKAVFGKEFPGSFAKFQDMKYNNKTEWDDLKSRFADTARFNKIVEESAVLNIKGKPIRNIERLDISSLKFNDAHINKDREHNVTKQDAQQFIKDAIVAYSRWNGDVIVYVSEKGACVINHRDATVSTAYSSEEYDVKLKELMERLKKND